MVVRRALGGLRDAGFVASERGHGGGWVFACDLHTVTLHDIYDAVGSPPVFAIGNREDNPACLVEQAVNEALGSVLREAEALLIERLGRITLAELSSDFNRRFAAQPRRKNLDEHRTKPQRPRRHRDRRQLRWSLGRTAVGPGALPGDGDRRGPAPQPIRRDIARFPRP